MRPSVANVMLSMKKEHGLTAADEDTTSESKVDNNRTEDYVCNYGCLHLSIGFFLRSTDDNGKEGDGEQLLRV